MSNPIVIVSPNTRYTEKYIESDYRYDSTQVTKERDILKVVPRVTRMQFRTVRNVPRLGVMLVGWGGNNGATVTAAVLANKHALSWNTKEGIQKANYYGSLLLSGTTFLGTSDVEEVHAPFKDLLPLADPNNLVISGWDISRCNLADAMERAKVLDYDLQRQLRPYMEKMQPLPGIFDGDFIAANQEDRADNILSGSKWEQVQQIQKNIRDFKAKEHLDTVVVLWTANTERFCDLGVGLNDTADNLLRSIQQDESEVSPSTLYAVASILENCSYINGSPQNTFVPGVLELAERRGVMVGGDDFKSGQTKFKSVLVDFLIGAGIKPVAMVSYNHLGNNDGKNLSAALQFRSKEISKSNVVDDMVSSNSILYSPGEKPDHVVVIKYVPYVGDSKRALDEYTSEIMMGGRSTIVVHNTCEDSLLAAPIILDLVLLAELCQRVTFRILGSSHASFQPMHPVLSVLSYLCKAPLVPHRAPVVNALARQRTCIENLFRGLLGLPPFNALGIENKLSDPAAWCSETLERVRAPDQDKISTYIKAQHDALSDRVLSTKELH